MASTDYYVVFSVGVDRLIERAGKASGRDGLKGRCAGNDFLAAAMSNEWATRCLAPPFGDVEITATASVKEILTRAAAR
jgi:hypothetical protein